MLHLSLGFHFTLLPLSGVCCHPFAVRVFLFSFNLVASYVLNECTYIHFFSYTPISIIFFYCLSIEANMSLLQIFFDTIYFSMDGSLILIVVVTHKLQPFFIVVTRFYDRVVKLVFQLVYNSLLLYSS